MMKQKPSLASFARCSTNLGILGGQWVSPS